MVTENMRGHACCIAPLEGHQFVGADYLCGFCHRPMALHQWPEPVPSPSNIDPSTQPIRSPQFVNITCGPLTDKKIEKYAEQGWYSSEFREARLARMNKKSKRSGNFVERDGRLIYSPV